MQGQRVSIAVEAGTIRRAACLMFGIPLLGFVMGLLLGIQLQLMEVELVLVAFSGLLLAVYVSHLLPRRGSRALPRIRVRNLLNNEGNPLF